MAATAVCNFAKMRHAEAVQGAQRFRYAVCSAIVLPFDWALDRGIIEEGVCSMQASITLEGSAGCVGRW